MPLLQTGKLGGKGKKLTAAQLRSEIGELSGRFYTLIPHATGMQVRPPQAPPSPLGFLGFPLPCRVPSLSSCLTFLRANKAEEVPAPRPCFLQILRRCFASPVCHLHRCPFSNSCNEIGTLIFSTLIIAAPSAY